MKNKTGFSLLRPSKKLLALAAFTAAALAGLPLSAAAADPMVFMRDAQPNFRTDQIPVLKREFPLFAPAPDGVNEQIKMTGIYNERSVRFYSKKGEVISKASVTLRYTPSPALIPQQSQLNVYLNGQLQKTLPISKEQLGNQVSATVDLNSRLIEASNRLTLEFIGQYTPVCGSVANPSLWLTVDSSSYLSLNTQKVRLANDLSILPTPFVNTVSPSASIVPMVFSGAPSSKEKQAAAVIASWAGVKAEWRGVEFPAYYNEQPSEQNFIAFATNDKRPEFLKFLPQVNAPTISVVDAPDSLFAKILVIAGRDDADLLTAARWLASADQSIAGGMVTIENFKEAAPRKAYDAPAWIRTDEKVPFEKIAKYRGQLSSSGFHPAPIKLEVRLPPDLYMVNRSNVNLDLKYRYTRPTSGEPAQMRFLLNDLLVESYDLNPKATSNSFSSQFSLLNGLANLWNNTSIPSKLLSPENILAFDFQYGLSVPGGSPDNCKSVALIPNQVEVDPSSTIDFSGFYHFAKLPDLRLFTVGGFPYSKYADLSETLVVMKADAAPNVMTTMLNTMGRFGAKLGYPATRVTVSETLDKSAASGKDVLVFAEASRGIPGLEKMDPEVLFGSVQKHLQKDFAPKGDTPQDKEAAEKGHAASSTVTEDAGIAAIVQFESPFDGGRSVVALLGDGQDGSYLLNKRLMNPGDMKDISGSVALFKQNANPVSFAAGPDYYTGSLPWHQRIWYSLLDQPLLLVLFTLVCALLAAGGIFWLMHSLVRLRSKRH